MSDFVFVTLVLESSLALAAEWPHVLSDYVVPLLHRLGDGHSPQFRMSLVGYGTADTRPNPILQKLFFIPPAQMLGKMREPHELGIGQTGSGGGYGMAALEGIVAALEMFDTLKLSIEKAEVTCLLIHIATTHPDPAERPLWNTSPALDSVTWDTLPTELRKRGVHYNNILLKQIPRFTELQASAAIGASQTPWFTVRSPHVVQLSGFPQPQKGTKRASNNAAAPDRSPEVAKRVKMQSTSPQKSPAVAPAIPSSSSPPAPAPPQAAGPTTESSIVTPAMLLDPTKRAEILERLQNAEMTLRQQMTQIVQLQKEGRLDAAHQLRLLVQQRSEKLKQFKSQVFAQAQQAQAQAQAKAQSQGQGQGQGQGQLPTPGPPTQASSSAPPPPATLKSPDPPQPSTTPVKPELVSHPPAPPPPPQQNVVVKPPLQPPPAVPPQMTPDIAAQIHKLIEQKNRLPTQTPHPPTASAAPDKPAQSNLRTHWHGTLSWRGFDSETHVRKDVHTRVVVLCKEEYSVVMRPDTWPTALALAPSQHHAVSEQALIKWLHQHKFIPVSIQPAPPSPDLPLHEAKANEEHYRGLIRLLSEKNVYALSAWPGANGVTENRLLLFAVKGLAGAYFPLPGGVPELPKGDPAPALIPTPAPPSAPAPAPASAPGQAQAISGIPPHVLNMLRQQMTREQQASFQALPPERKANLLRSLAQRLTENMKQQQQQQQAQMTNMSAQQSMNPWMPGTSTAPTMNSMAAIISQFASQNQNQGQNQNQNQHHMQQNQVGPSNQDPNAVAQNLMQGQNPMGNMNMQVSMGANMGNMNVGNMGMNFGMGAPQQPQGQQGGMMPGMHRRTPSGNAQVSYEMLQSFMQRSHNGTGTMGGMA